MPLLKTLVRLKEANPEKIETIEDETEDGNGYWLYLNTGWCTDDIGSHIIHGDTVQEVASQFKYVQRCFCNQCSR